MSAIGIRLVRRWALGRVLHDSGLSLRRTCLALLTGSVSLGSAVGLSAVAAWMIARAAGMPSPADLAVASVMVRFFGLGRGIFRYLERLASHRVALQGAVSLRVRLYERLADAPPARVLHLTRGQILARLGGDVDDIADAVVRGIIPLAVAVVVSLVSIAITTVLLPLAGLSLAVCLLLAGVGGAALTLRAARVAAHLAITADARVTESALSALEAASEHRVWGTVHSAATDLASADVDAAKAHEATAKPAAWAAGVQAFAAGAALIAALAFAVLAAHAGAVNPMEAAIVALLPLAAFESVGTVPSAVQQLFRSARAAERIEQLAPALEPIASSPTSASDDAKPATKGALEHEKASIAATNLSSAWPAMTPTRPVSLSVKPGEVVAVVGRSGIGKTTLLVTLAGVLPPASGEVLVAGATADETTLGTLVAVTAEDAHLFGTTVLENLRVGRGDLSERQAHEALDVVGLGEWLAALPAGLDTVLGPGGDSISGGERRRLLLARVLVTDHPIHLIDEPGEHLDTHGRAALLAVLHRMRAQGRSVVIVTHDLSLLDAADRTVDLDG